MLTLFSCKNEDRTTNLSARRSNFEQLKETAKHHSQYLDFAYKKLDEILPTRGETMDDKQLIDKLNTLGEEYIFVSFSDPVEREAVSKSFALAAEHHYDFLTNSNGYTRSTSPASLAGDAFLEEVDNLEEGLSAEALAKSVEEILFSEKYAALSDEDFEVLSFVAATYIDSYTYWSENYQDWTGMGESTRGFWSRLWNGVKRYATVDAKAGLQGAIVGAIGSAPGAVAGAFLSAGVGSVWQAGEDIIDGNYPQ